MSGTDATISVLFNNRLIIMAPIGFRILPFAPQPSPKIIGALRRIATAHLSDNMHRLHAIGPDLWPCHRGGRLVGPALTVKVGPGDNLMVHKAIDIARPGDVIVVDAGGVNTQAIIGEIMSSLAERNGAAGVGQSSWGPTGFAVCESEAAATDLAARATALGLPGETVELQICAARNRGADLWTDVSATTREHAAGLLAAAPEDSIARERQR